MLNITTSIQDAKSLIMEDKPIDLKIENTINHLKQINFAYIL